MSDLPPPIMFCCRTPEWKPYCGQCGFCGKDLVNTGYACRASKDVRPPHLDEYNKNHYWGQARFEALRRDEYKCVKCGWPEGVDQSICPDCETPYVRPRFETTRWCIPCRKSAGRGPLEVNHIIPRDGNKDDNSCFHHLENLETLCHACHVDVTAEQRGFKFKSVWVNGVWVRVRRDQTALPLLTVKE